MTFFQGDGSIAEIGSRLVSTILADNTGLGLTPDTFCLTLAVYDGAGAPRGFSHNGDVPFYPCSVIKAFWMAAARHCLEIGRIVPHAELDRAMHDMIKWSSNTATNYIIDLVTGTTGDTLLDGRELQDWVHRRGWANRWIRSFDWPEMAPINMAQKNMDDDRYGRERQLVDALGHNSLTTNATARLFHEIFNGQTFSRDDQLAMQALLARRHDAAWVAANPNAQVTGYFGAGLPADARLWSKAGWTGWTGDARASYRRHDAARIEVPGLAPLILVIFTEGRPMSESTHTLPNAVSRAIEIVRSMS
jgi:beta-lactamase class A